MRTMQSETEKQQPKSLDVCPTCGRPRHSPPHVENKKYFGLPDWAWVVLVIVILLGAGAYLFYVTISSIVGPIIGSGGRTIPYSTEVIISEGGNFTYSLGGYYSYNDVVEVTLNISSRDGNRFDVYIMDSNEYENAYRKSNGSNISVFSAQYSKENITQLIDVIDLSNRYGTFYLVIDNRNTTLTPNDATPTGIITVDVKITTKTAYRYD